MARKESSGSAATRGFDDIIGVVLLVAAALLLIAQWSFDRHDIGFNNMPPNETTHNWIGPLGAYLAWGGFLMFGAVGYFLPALFAIFGAAFLLGLLVLDLGFLVYAHRKAEAKLAREVASAARSLSEAIRDERAGRPTARRDSAR